MSSGEQIVANNAKTCFVLANKPFESENSQLCDFRCDLIGPQTPTMAEQAKEAVYARSCDAKSGVSAKTGLILLSASGFPLGVAQSVQN